MHHSAAGWIAAGGRGAPTVALKAAVLDTIQGGHKALQAEHEPAGQSGNGRRTQANRDRRQTKKRRLQADREELARHRSSSTNQEKSGPSPKGKGRESQRTNRAKRYASAGLREGERAQTSHLEVNAGEPSKECANADCACHRLTRSQIAGQPERKTLKCWPRCENCEMEGNAASFHISFDVRPTDLKVQFCLIPVARAVHFILLGDVLLYFQTDVT